MRVRAKRVDMYGLCGRDHHPLRADVGRTGTVVDASVDPVALADGSDPDNPEPLVIFLTRLDGAEGRLVEFAEYEVEIIGREETS